MEPQFTPGPWTWTEDGILGEETPVLFVRAGRGDAGSGCPECVRRLTISREDRNLILAAPEPYGALRELHAAYGWSLSEHHQHQIRAVLAKARGEQEGA